MNGGIEAVAIKNLQTILKSRGISSEALFSKYDLDGNGSLSYDEFGAALASITGQKAPASIVNAIFSVLDSDGNGFIDLQEILVLIETGPSESYDNESSLTVSDHPNNLYNGSYELQGELNGKPLFVNRNSAKLFYYNAGSGGAPSWSLDNRELDGTQDFYRGGWTRPPAGGGLPIGTRRWVGVGRITIRMVRDEEESQPSRDMPSAELVEPAVSQSDDSSNASNLMDSVSVEFSEILGDMKGSDISDAAGLEAARSSMDERAELSISKLPSFLQPPARELWKVKADSLQEIALSNLVIGASAVAGLSAGALGVSTISSNEENEQVQIQKVASESTNETYSGTTNTGEKPEEATADSKAESEVTKVEQPTVEQAIPEALTIFSMVESFSQARMLSEQNALKEELSGTLVDISIKITSVERTFGIGISERYRGGNTAVASLYEKGVLSGHAVEIRVPSDAGDSVLKTGYEGEVSCEVSGWNGIRKRLILDSQ